MGTVGNAVLLLRPEEKDFVDYLKEAKIYLDKYESWDKFSNLQPKVNNFPVFHFRSAYKIFFNHRVVDMD